MANTAGSVVVVGAAGLPAPGGPSPAALSLVLSAEIGSVMTAIRQNAKWGAPVGRYNVSLSSCR